MKTEDKRGESKPECRKILSQILPHLFVGSADDISESSLLENRIDLVINATTQYEKPKYLLDENYLQIPVLDTESESLIDFFDQCFDFIDNARLKNKRVMVHCQAGKSRSATIAIAYIMRYKKLSMDEAHLFVRSKRHQIDPNFAFLGQLLDYERKLSGETARVTPDGIENKTVEKATQKTEIRLAERRKIIAPKTTAWFTCDWGYEEEKVEEF
ncbi:Oidioi.mRNA.OKI2018_I69.chr2.g4359.t1.cds [Oikopleura dioica]|uniref:protein-tyrosine-phosphatase n=1 Tax=Oikopleura dioica TaxID=34765 RepID=A0ABN7SWU8_OIKDI|nr:Oidioi.mRNA.OKI2018_I69.chr2.g4359.t1.cds [Oikopleura dioica]